LPAVGQLLLDRRLRIGALLDDLLLLRTRSTGAGRRMLRPDLLPPENLC
jgi:hypothetical protein